MIKYILFSLIKKNQQKSTAEGLLSKEGHWMQQGASCVHCKWCQPELCPSTDGVHPGQKSALYGQGISFSLFLSILRKGAFLPHSSELIFWSPSEVLPGFFLSHPTYLKLFVFGNANMLQVWPRVLLKCWILKNQLEGLEDYLGQGWGHRGRNTAQQ